MRRSDSDPQEPTELPTDAVIVTADGARRLPDRTDHAALDAMTDQDIERAVADDPNTAPILNDGEMEAIEPTVHYVALMGKDGTRTTIEFPDCPGCATFAEAEDNPEAVAREALEAWLESQLEGGASIPRPTDSIAATGQAIAALIPISPALAVRLQARLDDRKEQ